MSKIPRSVYEIGLYDLARPMFEDIGLNHHGPFSIWGIPLGNPDNYDSHDVTVFAEFETYAKAHPDGESDIAVTQLKLQVCLEDAMEDDPFALTEGYCREDFEALLQYESWDFQPAMKEVFRSFLDKVDSIPSYCSEGVDSWGLRYFYPGFSTWAPAAKVAEQVSRKMSIPYRTNYEEVLFGFEGGWSVKVPYTLFPDHPAYDPNANVLLHAPEDGLVFSERGSWGRGYRKACDFIELYLRAYHPGDQ